jgi:hypothetical protein
MTVAVWLQDHPALYIPVFGVIGGVSVLVQRSGRMPGRITIWFLVYVLYQSSELRDSRLKDTIAAALWVAPAAVWTYVVCFWLWPRRNPETSGVREGEEKQMSVRRHALCGGLSIAVASVVAFACRLPHTNWAIWSSYTVIRPSRKASLKRSVERLLGAVIGCSVGFFAIKAFGELPLLLGTLTILAVFLMVAFQKYTLAVAVRSALAPLAAFALHGDPIGTALARFLCILVGVIIGTFFMLSFTKE